MHSLGATLTTDGLSITLILSLVDNTCTFWGGGLKWLFSFAFCQHGIAAEKCTYENSCA